MNKRYYAIVILVCLVLVLSACKGKSGSSTGSAPRIPFIGGTAGVTMEFEKDSPPPEVTDDQSFAFNVLVRLKNDGETSIDKNNIRLNLIGFDPSDFGKDFSQLRDVVPEDDLQSTKRDAEGNTVEGTTTFATFPKDGTNFIPSKFIGNTEETFRAEACYLYNTQSTTKICGLKDMINVVTGSTCIPTQSKPVYSSSAPVQVVNFKQSVVGRDKISFSFDVVLNGNVDIFWNKNSEITPASGGFEGACPKDPRTRREVENNVAIEITEIPTDPVFTNLKCGGLDNTNFGVVKIINGRRTITCTVEFVQDREDFDKNIGINLKYNVLDNRETTVLIKHLAVAP